MFATSSGGVRRNSLSDFTNIRANGKIAMKLEEGGERLVAVAPCNEQNDVMLDPLRKCIRFHVGDVRIFSGRTSTGVRGIRLSAGDAVMSMSILNHVDFDMTQRDAYLRAAAQARRGGEVKHPVTLKRRLKRVLLIRKISRAFRRRKNLS